MRHGSLFSGIGGFDLAAEWMGWENVLHCEINEFGRKVLTHYWPEAISLSDIHKAKFKRDERGNVWVRRDGIAENAMHSGCVHGEFKQEGAEVWQQRNTCTGDCNGVHSQPQEEADWLNIGAVDIITGGFPCQPFSMAGKRKGTDDERHLWPEMLRAIREIQPRWIVGENVPGIVNWSGGLVFEQVQADLETEGYEVQAFILPACGVNAPHRRDRIWFVAHRQRPDGNTASNGKAEIGKVFTEGTRDKASSDTIGIYRPASYSQNNGRIGFDKQRENIDTEGRSIYECETKGWDEIRPIIERHSQERPTPDTDSRRQPKQEYRQAQPRRTAKTSISGNWQNFPTQSPVCGRNDGISSRLVGITFSKHRNESIKAYGNAVVPNVVYQIFKAIQQYEDAINNTPDTAQ